MSYCVHAAPDEVARPHRVEAASVLDAALLYAERWLAAAGDEAVTLVVQDESTGIEHCLTLHLDTGEAQACAAAPRRAA